ncbi:putative transmembrane protein [Lupinus albus]|uniref:Putative transmembrane protein n=1 Tax=Lupinus albus TaxID=3870 RepID=A0A6A4Q2B6_LUPAL|nr:putative transmembrane protein [Lupinus albus]
MLSSLSSFMEFKTLFITSSNLWGMLQAIKTFNFFVILSCTFFCAARYGLCSTNGMQNPTEEYDACEHFAKSYNLAVVGDTSLYYGSPTINSVFESVCPDNHSFCFPSTLSGFNHKQKCVKSTSVGDSGRQNNGPFCVRLAQDSKQGSNISWSSEYGLFKMLNGGVVSCSMNSRGVNDVSKNFEMSKSSSIDGSSAPHVRIDPTVLDWGQNYLYSPSVAFLTVANVCNDSILHLYEPFSNDLQFYPCNFSEVSLRPGESASICFVFFPRCLGMSSADLILQTSFGGFVVESKGYACESPFGIQPLSGLSVSPGGKLSKSFVLPNPYNETLRVEEITASISVSLGHNFVEREATCGVNNFQVSDSSNQALVVKSCQTGSPVVAIKPHRVLQIGPHSSETLLDIDITVELEGRIFGALCLQLRRSSQDKSDTIVVPVEAEMNSHFGDDKAGVFVSAMLEGLALCEGGESVITISLRNNGPTVLSFVKALEVAFTELFHMKYMDDMLLFPGTVTQVGLIYCNHLHTDLHDMPKSSNLRQNCKLVILTNDSTSPQIEIPCEDILHICFEHQRRLSVEVEEKSKDIKSGNTGAGYEVRNMQPPPNVNVIERGDVDELVLRNWKSQGTSDGMSVLEDHEFLFPLVQVGSYVSRRITVKNPSQHAVMMQLILNSGEIVEKCKGPDHLLHPSSSGLVLDEATAPTKYGFSLPESAVTEAYVPPYGNITFGPIIFYPSRPCGWSGSALIRNNLSGVEWIPLRGFGGLLSLVLLETSERVHNINFDFKMRKPLNFSLPYAFLHLKEITSACSKPLVKELYAKNTGDLPLEVKTVRVSGRECGLDGFKIHACRGFALLPGESTKLLISYQTDFSAAMVHRDLELVLATGIFLIPMKASFPYDVQSNCKKSIFWMRAKQWFLGFLLVASLILLLLCSIAPQTVPFSSVDYSCKSDDIPIRTTIKRAGKSPLLPCNQRKSKPSKNEVSQHLMQTSENNKHSSHLLHTTPDERKSPSTGKEKSRRRKRKNSLGAKSPSFSEVSSSHSGISPTSPLSPAASSRKSNSPSPIDVEEPSRVAHRLITPAPVKTNVLEPKVAVKFCSNNKKVSSLQVPDSVSSTNAATTTIPVKTRTLSAVRKSAVTVVAGGIVVKHKDDVEGGKVGDGDEYRYDIWGDHLSWIHLLVPKNVTCMKSIPHGNNFDSFFVQGPLTLITNSHQS